MVPLRWKKNISTTLKSLQHSSPKARMTGILHPSILMESERRVSKKKTTTTTIPAAIQ